MAEVEMYPLRFVADEKFIKELFALRWVLL